MGGWAVYCGAGLMSFNVFLRSSMKVWTVSSVAGSSSSESVSRASVSVPDEETSEFVTSSGFY